MFIIEDQSHAEIQEGEFLNFENAYRELERRAKIPWNEEPNRCPCKNWIDCQRNYEIIEYDSTKTPWKILKRTEVLSISAKGIQWSKK